MREKVIETRVKKFLSEIGAYFVKIHGSNFQEPGIPDIISCYKGYFIGIETKAGGIYILTDNVDDVKRVIGGLK